MLCRALDAAGLKDYRVGLGDAVAVPGADGEPAACREAARARPARGARARATSSGSSSALARVGPRAARRPSCCSSVPQRRGGPEVLADAARPRPPRRSPGMRQVHELLEPDVAERVIFDLGLVRNIGYYTGAVFEVYDPALGAPLGGGGRYDELLGRFGRPLPAVGFALDVERLHIALAGEERGTGALRGATPDARDEPDGRPDDRRAARRAVRRAPSTCSTRSGSTPPSCAPTTASCCSRTSA